MSSLESTVTTLLFHSIHYHCCYHYLTIFVAFGLDYLQQRASGSTLYGFRGGPAGIMKGKYVDLTAEFIYPYRNQVLTSFYFVLVLLSFVTFVDLDRLRIMGF